MSEAPRRLPLVLGFHPWGPKNEIPLIRLSFILGFHIRHPKNEILPVELSYVRSQKEIPQVGLSYSSSQEWDPACWAVIFEIPRMRSRLLGSHMRGPNNEIPPVGLSYSRSHYWDLEYESPKGGISLLTSNMRDQKLGSQYCDLEYESPKGGISLVGPRIWEPKRWDLIIGTSNMTAQQAGPHSWDLEDDSPTGRISFLGSHSWLFLSFLGVSGAEGVEYKSPLRRW
jgi:hypothetical protein